jgi:hypothetical protein
MNLSIFKQLTQVFENIPEKSFMQIHFEIILQGFSDQSAANF